MPKYALWQKGDFYKVSNEGLAWFDVKFNHSRGVLRTKNTKLFQRYIYLGSFLYCTETVFNFALVFFVQPLRTLSEVLPWSGLKS